MTGAFPIEGYAAIYGERDMNGDVVERGAFARALAAGPASVKLLYQHAVESPIGRWLSFEDRASGLYARGEILLATQCAQEAAALIRARILDGLSIGFRTVKAERRGGARKILDADLWEVSVVTFPMARRARLVFAAEETPILAFADHVRKAAKILSV